MGGVIAPQARIGGSAAAPGIPLQDVSTAGLFQLPGLNGVGIAVGGVQYAAFSNLRFDLGYAPTPTFDLAVLAASPFAGFNTATDIVSTPNGKFIIASNQAVGFGTTVHERNQITGGITPVAGSPFAVAGTYGNGIAISKDGLFVYVALNADYIAVYSVDPTSGALALVQNQMSPTAIPAAPSPGCIHVTDDNAFVMCADWNDVRVYRRDILTGVTTEVAGSPFAVGPVARSVVSTPDGKFVYVTQQTNALVSAFAWDSVAETLTPLPVPTYACGAGAQGMTMAPDGSAIYITNFNAATISAFLINADGSLTPVAGSPIGCSAQPRQISISSDGLGMVVSGTSTNAYSITPGTGVLAPLAGSPFATALVYSVHFSPDDRHVYMGSSTVGGTVMLGFDTTASPTYNLVNLVFDPLGGLGGGFYINGRLFINGGEEVANGYRTADVTPLPTPGAATAYTAAHGCTNGPRSLDLELVCLAADAGHAIGDVVKRPFLLNAGVEYNLNCRFDATLAGFTMPGGYTLGIQDKATGLPVAPTPASWAYRFYVGP